MSTPPKARIFVYQIYYNEKTRDALAPGFIPLDNTENRRPDWYEFWVIRNFLKSNPLDDNAWYGFLSPKFEMKAGFSSGYVLNALDKIDANFEVALFSSVIDHLAYFENPFKNLDHFYPGSLRLSQRFFEMCGLDVDLETLVTCLSNSVYSNYIIAKPRFWNRWLSIADVFFDYVENSGEADASLYRSTVPYRNIQVPLKVFVQERFASAILSRFPFKVFVPDENRYFHRFNTRGRRFFTTCDVLKEQYCLTKNIQYLNMFKTFRDDMPHIRLMSIGRV